MQKLFMPAGQHTSHGFGLKDSKRIQKADLQTIEKEKKHCQGVQLVCTQQEEALHRMEGMTYDSGAFQLLPLQASGNKI